MPDGRSRGGGGSKRNKHNRNGQREVLRNKDTGSQSFSEEPVLACGCSGGPLGVEGAGSGWSR